MLDNHFYFNYVEMFPIHSKTGVGLHFEHKGKNYKSVAHFDENGYRFAELRIHSYIDAGIHFYGTICIGGCMLQEENSTTMNFIPKVELPRECKAFNLDILRPIEKWELERYPVRFKGYLEGDLTNAFYTENAIIEIFKKYISKVLTGKWLVRCNGWNTEDEIIIIE